MITITIDGKQIQTEQGTSVLEAALQNNIYIPHICHHPDLKDISACKLCYVQVEGQDKPVTSCMLKAEDGMNIVTTNEEIQRWSLFWQHIQKTVQLVQSMEIVSYRI